jgi:hypothetical protein
MDEEDIVYGPYVLPEIGIGEDQEASQDILTSLIQEITNINIAENAEQSLAQGDIISRPSISFPGITRYDNTCFQYGKNVCKESGYTNIPDSIYDNRTFARNYEKLGFDKVSTENMLPGDFIQFVDPDRATSEFPEGFPFHFGIVQSDSTYTQSGGMGTTLGIRNPLAGQPVMSKNIYYDSEGERKDPFLVYRLTDPKPITIAEAL